MSRLQELRSILRLLYANANNFTVTRFKAEHIAHTFRFYIYAHTHYATGLILIHTVSRFQKGQSHLLLL